MYRRHATAYLLVIMMILPSQAFSAKKEPAKEDTAHISLEKTATAAQKTKTYLVKKGDSISKIMQEIPGITAHRYTRIKELNPALKNIHMIHPGQILILPTESSPKEPKGAEAAYTTRRGDSLTRIIVRELNVDTADIPNIIKQVRRLNPEITNPNLIYPGQVLALPRKGTAGSVGETAPQAAESSASRTSEVPETAALSGTTSPTENNAATEEKLTVAQEKRLTVISHVIKQMNGNIISTGSYFIPIPQTGRIAIDCTAIPIAELNDGSTILMDFTGRLSESVRQVIQMHWKNYSLVRPSLREDTSATLQKIINSSREYTIAKWGKPVAIGSDSLIQITPDWIITRKISPGGSSYRQGLFFLSDMSQLLPRPIISYAGKNGFVITEIIEGTGIVGRQQAMETLLAVPVIRGATPLDTVFNLLTFLGHQPTRDADVNIFDTIKDGFNLTVRAGLLVKIDDRRILFHSQKLPQQFLDILKEGNAEVIIFPDNESAKTSIEKTLQAINIPFSPDNFSFTLPGGKTDTLQTTLSFPAIKVERDRGPLYLVNFVLDRDIQELLHTRGGAEIVRY